MDKTVGIEITIQYCDKMYDPVSPSVHPCQFEIRLHFWNMDSLL